jgi:hypothetical protein
LEIPYVEAAVVRLVLDFAVEIDRYVEENEKYIFLKGIKLRRCALRQDTATQDLVFSVWTDLKNNPAIWIA